MPIQVRRGYCLLNELQLITLSEDLPVRTRACNTAEVCSTENRGNMMAVTHDVHSALDSQVCSETWLAANATNDSAWTERDKYRSHCQTSRDDPAETRL